MNKYEIMFIVKPDVEERTTSCSMIGPASSSEVT